ncbi:MAG: hypothetical protein JRI92_04725 [Deltaproteobacteria bacterium]|nr:hypothetical protein [Deltaproteobacteria bacterium]MBW1821061.1 hypothetical protein [Deltaproteobacteria bacterium]
MAGIFGKIKQRILRLSGKMDQYQEAITFAEAGESEHAREVLQEQPETMETAKLIVVGQEGTFSQEMIDYALDMAKRMSYEIVALNTAPFSCDTFKLFASSRDQLCTDFKELSTKNADVFQKEAVREGISFSHVIKFSEIDEAIESVCKEFGEVAFVVSASQEQQADSRIEQGERLQQKLFVYTVV